MQKFLYFLCLLLSAVIVSGCVSQNIPLDNGFWIDQNKKVVVASEQVLSPQLYQEGREGVLDVLINSAVTSDFSHHLEKYNTKNLYDLKYEFVKQLQKNDIQSVPYKPNFDLEKLSDSNLDANKFAEKNFLLYSNKIEGNHMLVLSVLSVGATRAYYGFIPLGPPVAICIVRGQLVDVLTNRILWRQTVNASAAVNGDWDQPPLYVNFDKALGQAIAAAKEKLLINFFGIKIID